MKLSLKIIASVLLLGLLGLWVINIFLVNAIPTPKRLTQGLEVDYPVDSGEFQRTLQAFSQFGVQPGNSIQHLVDGEEIYGAKLAAIDAADYSVTFEVYEFYGDDAAKPMAEALANAARRGVAVHVLLDFMGSMAAEKEWFELMEDAGVNLHRYHAPSWYNLTNLNYRTHRKILVTDGRYGFMGGANIGDDWLHGDDGYGFRDHHFLMQGPIVASIQAIFADNWLNATGVMIEGDRYFPELEEMGDVTLQAIKSSPSKGHHRIRAMYMYALASAETQFTASTAYFYPDGPFMDAIMMALERGVEVRIMLSGDEMDKGYVRDASVNRWRELLDAGMQIYKYEEAMNHSKIMVVDDHWATFGSANIDNRSFRINDEANIQVWSPEFAVQLREIIEADMAQATLFTLDDWHERTWYERAYGRIAGVLGAHF